MVADDRSGRVVFMAHSLLNQNTRYPGGAVCPGVVAEAVDPYLNDGVGIVQMECPEQRVWGGVLKRRFLWVIDHPRLAGLSGALSTLVGAYLRLRYRPIAARVVRDVEDYLESGFEVVGVLGVAGSPSCGVNTTLDLGRALKAIGSCPLSSPATGSALRPVAEGSAVPGQGLFIASLADGMSRRLIRVPLDEFQLVASSPSHGAGP
jgi:predicted secreted protein